MGTGSYKVEELAAQDSVLKDLDIGTKYLENTSAGTIALQSKQAYGEWEFDLYKSGIVQSEYINFISDRIGSYNSSLGYHIRRGLDGELFLRLANYGSPSVLFQTANSYIDINTWYRLKVARLQSEGVFKDIETLQVSDMVNQSYTSFTNASRYGFSAISNGSSVQVAGTADEISIVNTESYLVEFDLKLNTGTAPLVRLAISLGNTAYSNTVTSSNRRNSHILTATGTTTGVLQFYNISTASDYEISGLTIRRIYDADDFAVFISGGSFGEQYTLVDTAGGSGTNPIGDSTYTTSGFFVSDLDAADAVTNLRLKDGVPQ